MKITEKITITNEDNMLLMARYPDNYFDLLITDFPYGLDVGNMAYVKERKTLARQKNGSMSNANKNKKLKPADWDKQTPSIEYFREITRVSKNQIFFGVEYVDWELGKGRIKWNKGVPVGMSFKPYEMAYCSFIEYEHEINYLWAGMMQGKSHLEPMIQQGNKSLNEKREHPTQKPVILFDLIFLFCIENGIDISKCLDTNVGLCSSALSALKFNEIKEFVCCDISSEYFNSSVKRIKQHTAQKSLF